MNGRTRRRKEKKKVKVRICSGEMISHEFEM
jgi:hypothetical protein